MNTILCAFLDPRVENWFLMKTPLSIFLIFVLYLLIVFAGPKIMRNRNAVNLKNVLIPYNAGLVVLSCYMFYEVGKSCLTVTILYIDM